MRKFLKIIGWTLAIIILAYLVSIPIMRQKFAVGEDAFFTPTPFVKDSLLKKVPDFRSFYTTRDTLRLAVEKFSGERKPDSIKINGVELKRDFRSFGENSTSEFYVFHPKTVRRVGIFWMGNGYNIFRLINNLSELSKRTGVEIYVLNYNKYGFSGGEARFGAQFPENQNFYRFVSQKRAVDFTAGHSLGTVFATKLAADNQIPSLFLLAPASNLQDLIAYFKGRTPVYFRPYLNAENLEKSDINRLGQSSENIKKYNGRLTIFHGTKDENLPYAMSEKILANCPSKNKELVKIDGGDHEAPYLKENWEKLISKVP